MKNVEKIQKLVYLSNSRDYTEQGDINDNKFFTRINGLLEQGWKVAHLTPNGIEIDSDDVKPTQRETFAAFVLLEKDAE